MAGSPSQRRLPARADGYELREQIGIGTCAAVYRAWCEQVKNEVAIKVVELEWLQAPLEDIGREIQVMSLSSHANVVPFSTAFVEGTDLWIVMPLLTGGSVLSLMNCAFREGLPEEYARYVLWCVLKALEYFHGNGQMHRDVKAANLLLDSNGNTMLADYGMMGWMVEGGLDRKQRQTFVGTPCWMAPEVMMQGDGYDYKADVWSLGITAIELAQGRAPYTNYAPMKVLFLTMQNPPPTLSGSAASQYSAKYKDFVASCLQKDPKVRPSAKQLLKHPLFANGVVKPKSLADTIAKLPPIGSRGGSQKQLFRQLQKVAAPQRSGIYDLSARGLGWDFGDDEGESQATMADGTATSGSNPAVNPNHVAVSPLPKTTSSLSSVPPQPMTHENNSVAELHALRTMTIAPDVGLVPESSSEPNLAARAAMKPAEETTGLNARAASMPVLPAEEVSNTPVPPTTAAFPENVPIVGKQAPTGWIGGVAAKTVGQLRKGRFTVSDVPNPQKLDGKIGGFLDSDSPEQNVMSSQATFSVEDGHVAPQPIPVSTVLPQSVRDREPPVSVAQQVDPPKQQQSRISQPVLSKGPVYSTQDERRASSSLKPISTPATSDNDFGAPGGANSKFPTISPTKPRVVQAFNSPSYAAAVAGTPRSDRSFISGVAQVVINSETKEGIPNTPSRIQKGSQSSNLLGSSSPLTSASSNSQQVTPSSGFLSSEGPSQSRAPFTGENSRPTTPAGQTPMKVQSIPSAVSAHAVASSASEVGRNGQTAMPSQVKIPLPNNYAYPSRDSYQAVPQVSPFTSGMVAVNSAISKTPQPVMQFSEPGAQVAPFDPSQVQVTTIATKSVTVNAPLPVHATNSTKAHVVIQNMSISSNAASQPQSIQALHTGVSSGQPNHIQAIPNVLAAPQVVVPIKSTAATVLQVTGPGSSVQKNNLHSNGANIGQVGPQNSFSSAPRRKSRFEVKDVERPSTSTITSNTGTTGSVGRTETVSNANVSGLPPVPGNNGVAPTVRPKSRFEVKDIDQKSRPPPLANGIGQNVPAIVNIGPPSSTSSLVGSRQGTPLVSPQPEANPAGNSAMGAAKLSLSLLGDLHAVVQQLVNENETLRREVALLRGKTGVGSGTGSDGGGGNGNVSGGEVSKRAGNLGTVTAVTHPGPHTHNSNSSSTNFYTTGGKITYPAGQSQPARAETGEGYFGEKWRWRQDKSVDATGSLEQARFVENSTMDGARERGLNISRGYERGGNIAASMKGELRFVEGQKGTRQSERGTQIRQEQGEDDMFGKDKSLQYENMGTESVMGSRNTEDMSDGDGIVFLKGSNVQTGSGQVGHGVVTSVNGAMGGRGTRGGEDVKGAGSMKREMYKRSGGTILSRTAAVVGDVGTMGSLIYPNGSNSIGLWHVAGESLPENGMASATEVIRGDRRGMDSSGHLMRGGTVEGNEGSG